MALTEYGELDALGLGALIAAGEVSAVEVIEEAITRAEALQPTLNFLAHSAFEQARERAADPARQRGPFSGVPWLVKELASSWAGLPFTNTLPLLKSQVASEDSELIRRLKAAGVIALGKSTSPEQGWALSTESSLHGVTRNPWDPERTPGGSSGGSAAAVAARVVPFADASDGGGSIRVPAANCGLVGLKPARGRISFAPMAVDFWYGGATLHCVSRSVRDSAALLDVTAGTLPGEPYRLPAPADSFLSAVSRPTGPLKIAMVTDAPDHGTPVDPEVRAGVESAGRQLEALGHHVELRAVPYDFWPLYKTYTAIIAVQTAAFFEGVYAGLGRPPAAGDMAELYRSMIEKGRAIAGTRHANDVESMRAMCRELACTMDSYDVWLMPTVPMLPRAHGYYDMNLDVEHYDDTRMGPDCCFTAPFNASGHPAISLPLAWSASGLPVGIQFVGRDGDESTLLSLAGELEQASPWAARRPPLCS